MGKRLYSMILCFVLISIGCSPMKPIGHATANSATVQTIQSVDKSKVPAPSSPPGQTTETLDQQLKQKLIDKYQGQTPHQWGEKVTGVKRHLDTRDKVVALTFDACGGPGGSGYDKKLIDFLIKSNIPATLFVNARWIDANQDAFMSLADNPLFEIENHGTEHKPLSVNGKKEYGIQGTRSAAEVVNEVQGNAGKIEKLTGIKPKFFRSGTAFYDEVAVKIVNELGEQAVNFDILGDAGATYTRAQIVKAGLRAASGSIMIYHMNHPEKATAEGIADLIPQLSKKGFRFVKLQQYLLK